jgi:protocatechuate 3,4-dioxygenase beta subunit
MQAEQTLYLLIPFLLHCALWHNCVAQTNQEIKIESRPTGQGYALCGSCSMPKEISSHVQLVSKSEPGEPIVLSGTIFENDGVTPDSGVVLFVYQTDAGGYYHRPEENVFHPRLAGWLVTGSDGRYEIRTVKPAPEILAPHEPAHIHAHIFGKGMPEHFLHEFWFQDDQRINPQDRALFEKLGHFSPIMALTKANDGISRGVRDIRVQPAPAWKYEKE